jgi:hypothetical protein
VIPRPHRLVESKQVLVGPLAEQRFGNGLFIPATTTISHRRQLLRIALAAENGPDDPHSGHTRNICDRLIQPHIHLCERLLHVLDRAGRRFDQHPSLPAVAPKRSYQLGRPKRRAQQVECVEHLHPLAVRHVRLLPVIDRLQAGRLGQQDPDPPSLQHFQQRHAVNARGLNRHRVHAHLHQPVRQLVQPTGQGRKLPYRWRRSFLRYRYPVELGARVDACRVVVDLFENPTTLLDLGPGSHSSGHHSSLSGADERKTLR